MYNIGRYVDWACANALKHRTMTLSGFGYFHKNCRFLWKKNVTKTKLGVQYNIPIRHITNISDFIWFQRSWGSMKSVSSFSSIDTLTCNNLGFLFIIFWYKTIWYIFMERFVVKCGVMDFYVLVKMNTLIWDCILGISILQE